MMRWRRTRRETPPSALTSAGISLNFVMKACLMTSTTTSEMMTTTTSGSNAHMYSEGTREEKGQTSTVFLRLEHFLRRYFCHGITVNDINAVENRLHCSHM